MKRLALCRICLCLNGDVRSVAEDTQLQELYERLTTMPFQTNDMRPLALCYICHAQLNAARRLMLNCLKAEELLTEMVYMLSSPEEDLKPMLIDRSAFTQLTISSVELMIIDSPDDDDIRVKEEIIAYEEALLKREFEEQKESLQAIPTDFSLYSDPGTEQSLSEPEDDIPLNDLRKSAKTSEQEEVRERKDEPSGSVEAAPIPMKAELDPEINESINDKYVNTIQLESSIHKCNYKNVKDSNQTHIKINSEIISSNNVSLNKTSYNNDTSSNLVDGSNLGTRVLSSVKDYICDVCNKCFSEKSTLARHCRTHASKKPYFCNECKKCFAHKHSLTRHSRTHTVDKRYVCNVCGKFFSGKYNLTVHARTHTGEKPYECNVCHQRFTEKSSLLRHSRTHTGDKPYVCNVCGKFFSEKCNLTLHARTHTGEKPYECNVCPQRFSEKSSLLRHARFHTGETPHLCNVCKKYFSDKFALTRHSRTHTGEKPHVCDVCKKGFNGKHHLLKHLRTHTDEKPYQCDVCKKCFRQKYQLIPHARTHTGQKPYQCNICNKSFSAHYEKIHSRIHTGEKPFACEICDKKFRFLHRFKSHLKTHM